MAKLLSDSEFAVRGRLVAVDNSDFVGPMITLRLPPNTADMRRPASYIDFVLLDTNRKTLQKRIGIEFVDKIAARKFGYGTVTASPDMIERIED